LFGWYEKYFPIVLKEKKKKKKEEKKKKKEPDNVKYQSQ
jgi:hypothetical protein